MQISGTKKLLELIPFAVVAHEEEDPFFSWHANVVLINRRKTIILMNDKTRYIVALHGIKAKDSKRLDELIVEAIRKTLQAERVREDLIEQYIEKAGKVTFHKSKNRTLVARLNKSCESIGYFPDKLDPVEIFGIEASKKASRMLAGGAKQPMIEPHEEMFKELQRLADDKNIFRGGSAVLHISLVLGKHSIWRRVIVPLHISFHTFHQILQVLFGWHDSHLHKFQFLKVESNEEGFGDGLEMEQEDHILLSEFIPPHNCIKYIYDFGDYWEHKIVVEEVKVDQPVRSPLCLEGEGTAPPEDCGGEPGFDQFLRVMQDPSHEDYQDLSKWAERQSHREFDKRLVNWTLEKF